MVVCLNNKDPNQPDRWLTSSLQANNFQVSKAMEPPPLNPLPNTKTSRWDTEDLPAPEATVVVSKPQMRNGVLRLPKALETDSVATKDNAALGTIRHGPHPICI